MKFPQFIVAGTARAGTTALYAYLRQHPQIFLPVVKEPCFFTFAGEEIEFTKGKFAFAVNDIEVYGQLYKKAAEDQITGDISTPYLYKYEKTISNIKMLHDYPEQIKVIIILRNPVERAYSQYMWRVRDGREEFTFEEALEQEANRMKKNYSFDYFYKDRGLYYEQVKAYLSNFKNVKIFLFEDLKTNPTHTLAQICKFIGVDDSFHFAKRNPNASFIPKSAMLSRLMTIESKTKFKLLNFLPGQLRSTITQQLFKLNASKQEIPKINPDTRTRLIEYFRDDILKLEQLIQRDLSAWLEKEKV